MISTNGKGDGKGDIIKRLKTIARITDDIRKLFYGAPTVMSPSS
jgi:hypothetical protein